MAFPLPAEVAAACAALGERLPSGSVRRVRAELMHLTLAFIGEVPEETARAAESAVREGAAAVGTFGARLGALGAFPSARRPRAIWVGLAEGAEDVAGAATAVRAALARHAVRFDAAPAAAHITIGRVREEVPPETRASIAAIVAQAQAEVPALRFEVGEMVLFRSILARQGPTYHRLLSIALR